jgi:hypothetical protein
MFCGQTFSRGDALHRHQRKAHPEEARS